MLRLFSLAAIFFIILIVITITVAAYCYCLGYRCCFCCWCCCCCCCCWYYWLLSISAIYLKNSHSLTYNTHTHTHDKLSNCAVMLGNLTRFIWRTKILFLPPINCCWRSPNWQLLTKRIRIGLHIRQQIRIKEYKHLELSSSQPASLTWEIFKLEISVEFC